MNAHTLTRDVLSALCLLAFIAGAFIGVPLIGQLLHRIMQ
jgi:hypothetical protein